MTALRIEYVPMPPEQVAAYLEALRIIARLLLEIQTESRPGAPPQ